MNHKYLRCVSVVTHPEAEHAVGELLYGIFDSGPVVWHDLESGESTVSVYLELTQSDTTSGRRALRVQLKTLTEYGLKTGSLKVSARKVKPEDWSESWKRHFKPIEIGKKLLIKPSWSKRRPRGGAKVIILDPGLSFGTGQHPTTSFCLEQLASARIRGDRQNFLDIGSGTGVLSIAAAKLGYNPVVGFDFDPVAVKIAKENAELNHCADIDYSEQDLLKMPVRSKAKFDVVCANLMYDVLMSGQTRILNRLHRSGRLVIAGILSTQFDQVITLFRAAGMKLVAQNEEREWTSGTLRFDELEAA